MMQQQVYNSTCQLFHPSFSTSSSLRQQRTQYGGRRDLTAEAASPRGTLGRSHKLLVHPYRPHPGVPPPTAHHCLVPLGMCWANSPTETDQHYKTAGRNTAAVCYISTLYHKQKVARCKMQAFSRNNLKQLSLAHHRVDYIEDDGWDFCSALWQLNLQGNQVLHHHQHHNDHQHHENIHHQNHHPLDLCSF